MVTKTKYIEENSTYIRKKLYILLIQPFYLVDIRFFCSQHWLLFDSEKKKVCCIECIRMRCREVHNTIVLCWLAVRMYSLTDISKLWKLISILLTIIESLGYLDKARCTKVEQSGKSIKQHQHVNFGVFFNLMKTILWSIYE